MSLASVVIAPNDKSPQPIASKPSQHSHTEQNPIKAAWETVFPDTISFFTFALVGSTILLWRATLRIARDTKRSGEIQANKMERSITEAAAAATAMERQNEISEDTAKRQLRAYVIAIDQDVIRFFNGGVVTFRAKLKNFGQTPATEVRCRTLVRATEKSVDEYRMMFRQARQEGGLSNSVLAPGDFHLIENAMEARLDHPTWEMILRGEIRMIFAGVISYRDSFGKRHLSTFKYFLPRPDNIKDTAFNLNACGNGNKAD